MTISARYPIQAFTITALAVAVMQASPARAQENQLQLEEVIVTAQKRTETLQDAPISIVAFDQSRLEERGIVNVLDIRHEVPNLQITAHPNSAITPRIFIRGVGNNDDQITQDPSVSVYLDGVYLARTQGLIVESADLERIEVLRGPQGTLYGRNATGGAINFVTQAPSTRDLAFEQKLTFGERNLFRSKSMVNVPVMENRAAVKLAYMKHKQDGFVENLGTGEDNFGDVDREAFRLDALWQMTDNLELRYGYDVSTIEDTPVFIAPVNINEDTSDRPDEGSPFTVDLPQNDIEVSGHALTLSWQLAEDLTLKSITSYREVDSKSYQDYNTGVFAPPPIVKTFVDVSQEQWSEEIQLLGNGFDDRLEYVLGLYYFSEEADSFDSSEIIFTGTSLRDVSTENSAYAIFGQGTYTPHILDSRLHLTFGARWSKDSREASLDTSFLTPGGVLIPNTPADAEEDYDQFSPSFVVRYDITDSSNVYARIAQGYKTGGFNVRASSVQRFSEGFDEETLISYELGLRSEWFDQRLRLNATAFFSDYEDIQLSVASDPNNPTVSDVLNAGEAEISGLELSMSALLTRYITLNLEYGYLDTDYKKIENVNGQDVSANYRFLTAPQSSYRADIRFNYPDLALGELKANIGYSWQDEVYSVGTVEFGRFIIDSYSLLSARVAWSSIPVAGGEGEIALWGKNLEDTEYYISHFNGGVPDAIFGEPRTYGVDLIYRF